MNVPVQCISSPSKVVGLHWFSGHAPPGTPVLVVCYQNGRLQLMKNHNDEGKILKKAVN